MGQAALAALASLAAVATWNLYQAGLSGIVFESPLSAICLWLYILNYAL